MLFEDKVRTMYLSFYGRILTKNRKAIRKKNSKNDRNKGKKHDFTENEKMKKMNKKVTLENPGNDPSTSSMLSGRSTI